MIFTILTWIVTIGGLGLFGAFGSKIGQSKKAKQSGDDALSQSHKKRAWLYFVLAILAVVLGQGIGLYDTFGNTVKNDLLTYINEELPPLVEYEDTAISTFDAVTGENYTDDLSLYTALTSTIIPVYGEMRAMLENITMNLKTKEVRNLNEIYIEAANEQYNAFVMFQTALEQGDSNLVLQANEKLDTGRKLLRTWQIELDDLCKKKGVIFKE